MACVYIRGIIQTYIPVVNNIMYTCAHAYAHAAHTRAAVLHAHTKYIVAHACMQPAMDVHAHAISIHTQCTCHTCKQHVLNRIRSDCLCLLNFMYNVMYRYIEAC